MNRSGEKNKLSAGKPDAENEIQHQNRRGFLKNMAVLSTVLTLPRPLGHLYHPASVGVLQQQDKNGVFIITKGEHSPEEIAAAVAEIPPVHYQPPSNRWLDLPRTADALRKAGGKLKIVMLGDSIINDTYRSQWYDLLQAQYPACGITAVAVVRGNTGCWWYKENNRIKHYVLPEQPDLLIIGGISQKNDIASIRQVIGQVRNAHPCDVLLLSPVFGTTDPNDDKQWTYDISLAPGDYRKDLLYLANESHSGFFDMCAPWGSYIRSSGHPVGWFHRDPVHANIRGEQMIGHLLAEYFSPSLSKV